MFGKIRRNFILAFVTAIAIFITSIATAEVDNNYLIEGKQYYDRGQYSEAVQLWQQVAERDNEIANKIIGYHYLAIAYQDLSQWNKSQREINNAFKR